MIKILKEGTRRICECESCGCLFSFDKEDIEVTHVNMEFDKYVKCPQCSVKIKISLVTKKEQLNLECPSCHGTGMTTPENKCGYCDGKGVVEGDKK